MLSNRVHIEMRLMAGLLVFRRLAPLLVWAPLAVAVEMAELNRFVMLNLEGSSSSESELEQF